MNETERFSIKKKKCKIKNNYIRGGIYEECMFNHFLLLFSCFLFAASLSIDYIAMHGSDGTSDFEVEAGETVTVRVKYDAPGTDWMSGDGVRYVNSSNNHKIGVFWYDESTPTGTQDGGSVVFSFW